MAPEPELTTRRSRKAASRGGSGSTAARRKKSNVLGPLLALLLVGGLIAGGVFLAWPYLKADPAQPDNLPYRVSVLGNGTPTGGPEEKTAYPTLAAADLARKINRVPVVQNDAEQSMQAKQLVPILDEVRSKENLAQADLVVVQLGGDGDFTPPGAESRDCKNTSCWGKEKNEFSASVTQILDKVKAAAPGTPILLVGTWSLFPNSTIAAADAPKVESLTNDTNSAMQNIAGVKGAFFLDPRDTLRGGEQKYFLPGSTRLNDAGNKKLAEVVAAAVNNAGALKAKGTTPVTETASAPAPQGGGPVQAPAT